MRSHILRNTNLLNGTGSGCGNHAKFAKAAARTPPKGPKISALIYESHKNFPLYQLFKTFPFVLNT